MSQRGPDRYAPTFGPGELAPRETSDTTPPDEVGIPPPPNTHWDPYAKDWVPSLTQEQVDGMWPNAKEKPKVEPIDDWLKDAMPNHPDRPQRLGRHREHPVHRRVTEGVDREAQDHMEAIAIRDRSTKSSLGRATQQANVLAALEADIEKDMVNLPEHYARFKIEPIHFIGENNLNWFQGNILKYMLRYDAKNGMEDLKKARRYMDMFIAHTAGDPDWWKVGKP